MTMTDVTVPSSPGPRLPAPGSFAAWIVAIRPKTLPAALAPVLVGTAIAYRASALHVAASLAAALGALLLQIASNLANDVFDFEQGKDTQARLGPVRAVQSGLLSPRQVRVGLLVTFIGCLLVGSYLVGRGGWPIVAVGLASMLAAVAYTAGPYPLGYHGLGDLFVFLFFGPVAVMGTTYVQSGSISSEAWWASLALGALTTNILVVNNLRDRFEDEKTGKRTLAVRFGKHFAMGEAAAMLLIGYAVPLYFSTLSRSGWPMGLTILTLPLAIRWHRAVGRTEGKNLNPLLASAAQFLLLHSLLFSVALTVSK